MTWKKFSEDGKTAPGKRHFEVHELDSGYVVEMYPNAYSFQDLSEVIRFSLILEKDEQIRKELAAQILDVFERVYKKER